MKASEPSRTLLVATGAALFGFFVLGMGSCTTADGVRREGTGPAAHGIHSDDLRAAMRQLDARSKEDVAAEMYTGSAARPAMDNVAQSARFIAATADQIPNILTAIDMEPDERREFLELAARLGSQARQLEAEARQGNLTAARRTKTRINSTCDACHGRFRIPY
jgi:predicted kinase